MNFAVALSLGGKGESEGETTRLVEETDASYATFRSKVNGKNWEWGDESDLAIVQAASLLGCARKERPLPLPLLRYSYKKDENRTKKRLAWYRLRFDNTTFYYLLIVLPYFALLLVQFFVPRTPSDERRVFWQLSHAAALTIEFGCLFCLAAAAAVCSMAGVGRSSTCMGTFHYAVLSVLTIDAVMYATMYPFPHYYRYTLALRPLLGLEYFPVLRRRLQGTFVTIYRARAVLLLLLFHIVFFTTLGVQLFHGTPEGAAHFATFGDSMISLIVLLTTCNSPSIMMPEFSTNRLCALYFILFIVIGLFLLLNLVLAIVYKEHKEFVSSELKRGAARRRLALRGAFNVLSYDGLFAPRIASMLHLAGYDAGVAQVAANTLTSQGSLTFTKFKSCLDVADAAADEARDMHHKKLEEFNKRSLSRRIVCHETRASLPCFGSVVFNTLDFAVNVVLTASLLTSVVMMCYDLHLFIDHEPWELKLFNGTMSIIFLFELLARIVAYGPAAYFRSSWNCFEAGIVIISASGVCLSAISTRKRLSRMISFVRQARILRLLRSVPTFRSLTETIGSLLPALEKFCGCLGVFYYIFAIIGVGLFGDVRLENGAYVANDFADMWSSCMTLFELMIVNDWNVTMATWVSATGTSWTRVYFLSWYLLAVVVLLNTVTSFVLEALEDELERKETVAAIQKAGKKVPAVDATSNEAPHHHHYEASTESSRSNASSAAYFTASDGENEL